MARVHVIKETTNYPLGDWQLFFQWCRYEMEDGTQYGYRFIWRRPDGKLQAARGQARIPTVAEGRALMDKAAAEAWGDRDWDKMQAAIERLEKEGCVVSLATGYVGWPDKQTALQGRLDQGMIDDARLIQAWA